MRTEPIRPINHRLYFRNWLLLHADGAIVGYANDCYECPLALFSGMRVWKKAYSRTIVPEDEQIRLPPWAISFIEAIDRDKLQDSVYKEAAVAALDLIPEDLG